LPIGLTIGFFFSGLIDMVLSGETPNISQLHPEIIYDSIVENERHRKLTLCIEIVVTLGIAAILLIKRKDTFESDTTQLTENIRTPVSLGQGQHGTARWLKKSGSCIKGVVLGKSETWETPRN